MVFTREYATAHQQVHRGIGVAARYKYTFVLTPSIVIPDDSNTVGCVLAINPAKLGINLGRKCSRRMRHTPTMA